MSIYLGDYLAAERHAAMAHAFHPDCTMQRDCPADDHLLDCRRFRSEQRQRRTDPKEQP